MKHTFLVLIASALVVSCCKQPACPPVQPPAATKLQGCWFGANNAFMYFGDSVFSKTNQFATPYIATCDSVYFLFESGAKFADFGYVLKGDTLVVYPVNPYPNAPFTYWR